MSHAHFLAAQDITLGYADVDVVSGLSVEIPPGKFTVIVGANACGKSTLLRGLARLLAPRSGTVLLDGKSIGGMPTREVATVMGVLEAKRVPLMSPLEVLRTIWISETEAAGVGSVAGLAAGALSEARRKEPAAMQARAVNPARRRRKE